MSLEPLQGGGSSWQNGQRPIRPVVNSMDETRRKIDEYDKSLPRTWAEATLPWVARSVAGELADKRYYLPENNRLAQAIPQRLANTVETSIHYGNLLGIDNYRVEKAEEVTWKTFLQKKQSYLDYQQAVRENFKNIQLPRVTPFQYLKHTVVQSNLANFVTDLQEGRIFPFLARAFGVGFFAWQAFRETQKAYRQAKTAEDGSLNSRFQTLFQTGKAFLKEGTKAIVSWELGTIGFILGSALFCVGTFPAIIAGCIAGGLLEACFRSGLNALKRDDLHPSVREQA